MVKSTMNDFPGMGAILHTLNLRLFPEQVAYIVNHTEDSVILVDGSLILLLAPIASQLPTVKTFIVIGDGDIDALPDALRYEELVAAEEPGFTWPDVDERSAAAMCYTSGTTGDPKGVVCSHRSTFLHVMAACMASSLGLGESDRVLPIVPMFHANAWGIPYACWMVGADLLLPDRFLQPEHTTRFIREEKATVVGGVPTIWNDILKFAADNEVDFSTVRLGICGGSAVPRALMERLERDHDVMVIQGWGMTETSPVAAFAFPPRRATEEEKLDWRVRAGRLVPGVELRVVAEGDGIVALRGGCRRGVPAAPDRRLGCDLRRADRPHRHGGPAARLGSGARRRRQDGLCDHRVGRRLEQSQPVDHRSTRRRRISTPWEQDVRLRLRRGRAHGRRRPHG